MTENISMISRSIEFWRSVSPFTKKPESAIGPDTFDEARRKQAEECAIELHHEVIVAAFVEIKAPSMHTRIPSIKPLIQKQILWIEANAQVENKEVVSREVEYEIGHEFLKKTPQFLRDMHDHVDFPLGVYTVLLSICKLFKGVLHVQAFAHNSYCSITSPKKDLRLEKSNREDILFHAYSLMSYLDNSPIDGKLTIEHRANLMNQLRNIPQEKRAAFVSHVQSQLSCTSTIKDFEVAIRK